MAAINVAGLTSWAKGVGGTAVGMAKGRSAAMMSRASGRAFQLQSFYNNFGGKAAWGAAGGGVRTGAWKGAAIGAGLGAGMSMYQDSSSGRGISVGRTLGGALRGGVLGGAAGGAYGAGGYFLGRANPMALAGPAAAARMGRMAQMRGAMGRAGSAIRNYSRYTGTGFATQTPTFSRAARSMAGAARDMPARMTAMEIMARGTNIRGSGLSISPRFRGTMSRLRNPDYR